jgi:hypothetical protein
MVICLFLSVGRCPFPCIQNTASAVRCNKKIALDRRKFSGHSYGMKNKAPDMIRHWLQTEGRKALWLASQVPADRATVSQWLTGRRKPLPPARRRLAEITGLPVDAKEAWE